MIESILFGPIPRPGAAPEAIGLDEVEQRRLAPLAEDDLAGVERLVDHEGRVRYVGAQALRETLVGRRDLLEVEPLGLVDALEPEVLLVERDLDLLAQDVRVEEILDADPDPRGLVRIGGPDPALGRADLELPQAVLRVLVDRQVPGHDQVRVAGEVEHRVVAPVLVELGDQHLRIDDAAVADDAGLAEDDPARNLADLEDHAIGDDGVPGVRATLVTADEVGVLREQVDDLALALVAPLRTDDYGRRHGDRGFCPKCRSPVAAGGSVVSARPVHDVVLALDAEDALDVHGMVIHLDVVARLQQGPVREALEERPVLEVQVVDEPARGRDAYRAHAACPISVAADSPWRTRSASTRWPAEQDATPVRAPSSMWPLTTRATAPPRPALARHTSQITSNSLTSGGTTTVCIFPLLR
jgi:hypothetical protein